MRIKQNLLRALRMARLLQFVDHSRMTREVVRTWRARRDFAARHPESPLPPVTLSYDAFGSLDPDSLFDQGKVHAAFIAERINAHHPAPQVVCDWGCGPMRVLQHMQDFMPSSRFVGLDYNPTTIEWCRAAWPRFEFRLNSQAPPLPLPDASVDALYCISVFTHLSEAMHGAFVIDIARVLKSGGILVATTHGDRERRKLLPAELAGYNAGRLVVRGQVQEGRRLFIAFHSPAYVRTLLKGWTVLEHNTDDRVPGFRQDCWVARRPVAREAS